MAEENLTEFDGREYGVGVVRGTRSFNVDETDGTLTGVYYRAPWQPGENNALCFAGGALVSYPMNPLAAHAFFDGEVIPLGKMSWPENHSMWGCSCGFYAYYDGSNDYFSAYTARVSGVVEGYGETVIGTKGFRTRKARIVALCIPGGVPDAKRAARWRPRNWSGVTHMKVAIGALGVLVGFLALSVVSAIVHGPALFFMPVLTGPLVFLGMFSMMRASLMPPRSDPKGVSAEGVARVRAKYGGIPVYNSFEDMIAAFPPDFKALKQMEKQ